MALLPLGLALAGWGVFRRVEQRNAERLPYHDRFSLDDLKGWQGLGGAWVTNAGTVVNDSAERGAKLLSGSDAWSDYSLSADVEVLGPDGDAGLMLRSTDEQLGSNARV